MLCNDTDCHFNVCRGVSSKMQYYVSAIFGNLCDLINGERTTFKLLPAVLVLTAASEMSKPLLSVDITQDADPVLHEPAAAELEEEIVVSDGDLKRRLANNIWQLFNSSFL